MSTPHRATPEQWALIASDAADCDLHCLCILELRARIEALEAAQRTTAINELRAASAEARPGGLVERVANAIYNVPHDSAAEARAAIREVAAWLRTSLLLHAADLLEMEADRG